MKTNAEIALEILLSERMNCAFAEPPEEWAQQLAALFRILLDGINAAHPSSNTNGDSKTQ